jgi:hypothetical protein
MLHRESPAQKRGTAARNVRIAAARAGCRSDLAQFACPMMSATGMPNSACFNTATICSTENLFLFMTNFLHFQSLPKNQSHVWIKFSRAHHTLSTTACISIEAMDSRSTGETALVGALAACRRGRVKTQRLHVLRGGFTPKEAIGDSCDSWEADIFMRDQIARFHTSSGDLGPSVGGVRKAELRHLADVTH